MVMAVSFFSSVGKWVVITDVGDGDTIVSIALRQSRRLHALLM